MWPLQLIAQPAAASLYTSQSRMLNVPAAAASVLLHPQLETQTGGKNHDGEGTYDGMVVVAIIVSKYNENVHDILKQ